MYQGTPSLETWLPGAIVEYGISLEVPLGTLQASAGHSSFSYIIGKGEARGDGWVLTAKSHSILHTLIREKQDQCNRLRSTNCT